MQSSQSLRQFQGRPGQEPAPPPVKDDSKGPKGWIRRHFAVKLIVIVVAVAGLVSLVSGGLLAFWESRGVDEQRAVELSDATADAAAAVGRRLEWASAVLWALGREPDLRTAVEQRNNGYPASEDGVRATLEQANAAWRSARLAAAAVPEEVTTDDSEEDPATVAAATTDVVAATTTDPSVAGQTVVIDPLTAVLESLRQRLPIATSLLLLDRYGAYVAGTQEPATYRFDDSAWWGDLLGDRNGEQAEGALVAAPLAGEQVSLPMIVPLLGATAEVEGALLAYLDVGALLREATGVRQLEGAEVSLAASDGRLLVGSSGPGADRHSDPGVLTLASAPIARADSRTVGLADGGEVIVAVAAPPDSTVLPSLAAVGLRVVTSRWLDGVWGWGDRQLWVRALVSLGALGLIGVLVMSLSRRPLRQLTDMGTALAKIREGDLEARVPVTSDDEVGQAARDLNTTLDATLALVQSEEERHELQESIVTLLDEVSGVAEGDLTREARVTDKITGALADSINYMIVELREIISSVQLATSAVSGATTEMRQSMGELADEAESQSTRITNSSRTLNEVAGSLRSAANQANQSDGLARASLEVAAGGHDVVGRTAAGMARIRDQVQDTTVRLRRLGEVGNEVGEITEVIADIAERTSLLALNASIQAAEAGPAGRAFSLLAEEIEKLSERSSDAARRIETLIGSFRGETAEAIGAMESTTREVVHGSGLVAEAGAALEQIRVATEKMAVTVQGIAEQIELQTSTTSQLSGVMSGLSAETLEHSSANRRLAQQTQQLAELAMELQSSVGRFRLPAEMSQRSLEAIPRLVG